MAEQWQEHAVRNIEDRHVSRIRELAESLRENAGYLLADLDRGREPRLRNVLGDAQQIAERIRALEAVREVTGIYESKDGE